MDKISKERRSANMSKIRNADTKPELVVRRSLHALGFRYRLHVKELPGKPDLVFPARKSVIFVHGCFWHQHSSEECADGRLPKSRLDYWIPKLARNIDRDSANIAELQSMGWRVAVVWECETANATRVVKRLRKFLTAS